MPITVESGTNYNAGESNIRLVAPSALPFMWDAVSRLMRDHPRGLLDGWFSEDEILGALTTNKYDLWVGLDPEEDMKLECVALCHLEKYSAFSIYRIMWAGGQIAKHLADMECQLSFYATSVLNANTLALNGSVGWIRKLEPFGFTPARTELWKPLGRRH